MTFVFYGYHEYEAKIAFDTLIKQFTGPNEIQLAGHSINEKDSVVNGDSVSVYHVVLKKKSDGMCKADFNIINGIANLVHYNMAVTTMDYSRMDHCKQALNAL